GAVTIRGDLCLVLPFAAVLVLSALLADGTTVVVTLLTCALFALPGIIVARSFAASALRTIVYGVPLGCSLTSLVVLFVVAMRGWDFRALLLAYLLALALLVALVSVRYRANARAAYAADEASSEGLPFLVAAGITLLVVLVSIPLANAGKLTSTGYAFTGLFGHDFILRGLDAVALA